MAAGAVGVLSAGTDPDLAVSSTVLESLAELGIDRGDQVPTLLTPGLIAQADLVVALKPDLGLPDHPNVQTWPLPDPADWDVEGIRPLRDHIDAQVRRLIDQLRSP